MTDKLTAKEELATIYCALEELSRWPELIGSIFRAELNGKEYAIPPEQVKGVFEAMKKRMEACKSVGVLAVQAWYREEGLLRRIEEIEAFAKKVLGEQELITKELERLKDKFIQLKETSKLPCEWCGHE